MLVVVGPVIPDIELLMACISVVADFCRACREEPDIADAVTFAVNTLDSEFAVSFIVEKSLDNDPAPVINEPKLDVDRVDDPAPYGNAFANPPPVAETNPEAGFVPVTESIKLAMEELFGFVPEDDAEATAIADAFVEINVDAILVLCCPVPPSTTAASLIPFSCFDNEIYVGSLNNESYAANAESIPGSPAGNVACAAS